MLKSYKVQFSFLEVQRNGDSGGHKECEDCSHSSYPHWFFSIFYFDFSKYQLIISKCN